MNCPCLAHKTTCDKAVEANMRSDIPEGIARTEQLTYRLLNSRFVGAGPVELFQLRFDDELDACARARHNGDRHWPLWEQLVEDWSDETGRGSVAAHLATNKSGKPHGAMLATVTSCTLIVAQLDEETLPRESQTRSKIGEVALRLTPA